MSTKLVYPLYMPIIISIFLFGLYTHTAAPVVYSGDSGELSAAVNIMGLAHPTGFPLYILSGKLFIAFFKFGSPAFGLHVFSALLTAISVGLIFLVLKNLNLSSPISIITTAVFGFGQTMWSHAGVARVYPLSLLLAVILFLIFSLWYNNPKNKHLYWYSLILGLSLGTHVLAIVMVVPLVIMVWQQKSSFKSPSYIKLFFLFTVPLIQYIYIPIAYSKNTIVNLGNINTFTGFIEYITQKDYSAKIVDRSLADIWLFIKETSKLFSLEFTPIFLLYAIIGLVVLYKNHKKLFAIIITIVAANMGILFFYGNSQDIILLFRYYFISYLALSVSIAFGLAFIINKIKSRENQILFYVAVILAVITQFSYSYKLNNRHTNYLTADFANNILDTMEPGAIFISAGDSVTGPLWYLQSMGQKEDITIIDINLIDKDWYMENESKRNHQVVSKDLTKLPTSKDKLLEIIRANIKYKNVYSIINPRDNDLAKEFDFLPVGIIHRVFKKDSIEITELKKLNNDMWNKYSKRNLEYERYKDQMDKQIVEIYSLMLNNLGTIYFKNGLKNDARDVFKQALKINPNNQIAKRNLEASY